MTVQHDNALAPATGGDRYSARLFGTFEIEGTAGPIDVGGKKLRALIAYLAATSPKPQSREQVMTLLWGSHYDTQARQNLRQALVRVRRAMDADAITGDDTWLGIDGRRFSVDVKHFETLIADGSTASLLAAYELQSAGEFLAGLDVAEPAFSGWIAGERRRLGELTVGVCMRLAEEKIANGSGAECLTFARRAIALAPAREDAHRLVLRAMLALGRRGDALRHFSDLEHMLQKDFGASPEPETVVLAEQIRRQPEPQKQSPVDPPPYDSVRADPYGEHGKPAQLALSASEATMSASRQPPAPATQNWLADGRRNRTWIDACRKALTSRAVQAVLLAMLALGIGLGEAALWPRNNDPNDLLEGEKILSAKMLENLAPVLDIEGFGILNGTPYIVSLNPGGKADVKLVAAQLDDTSVAGWRDSGRWWLVGNTLNFQFGTWAQHRHLKRWVASKGDQEILFLATRRRSTEFAYKRSPDTHWGALSVVNGTNAGQSYGHASRDSAAAAARAACGTDPSCKTYIVEKDGCVALAAVQAPNGVGAFVYQSPHAMLTRKAAINNCTKRTDGAVCALNALVCADGRHKWLQPSEPS